MHREDDSGSNIVTQVFEVDTTDRGYREQFTQAYKVLYKGERLSYLTEILDSAQ